MIFKHAVPILYSADVRKSLRYYTEVLGFESKWEWDDPPTFGGVSKNSVQIFFCKEGQGNPGTWLSIMISNVDELYERIKSHDGKVLSSPENMDWGLREMVVEDPDGHRIRFGQNTPRQGHGTSEPFPENLRIVERLPSVKEFQNLVSAVGWGEKTETYTEKLLTAPIYSVVAEVITTGEAVGCVLLLGDDLSFYYIKDMMVDPKYQNKKVGSALMEALTKFIEERAPAHALVGLYTGENLMGFYRQFGFAPSFGMTRRISKPV
jgi:ribosomal protein S18 acetylase RimI-like enzyme